MNRFVPLLALILALVVGCKKAPPPTAESLAKHGPPSAYAPPSAIVIPDSGDANANLESLSLALRKYIAGSHRMPTNFNDFLARSGVQPPAPPAGQKYALQGQAIVLVKE